jgi:hypothetical protein
VEDQRLCHFALEPDVFEDDSMRSGNGTHDQTVNGQDVRKLHVMSGQDFSALFYMRF